MNNYRYRVAEFDFVVELPERADVDGLLPSFAPFAVEEAKDDCLFRFSTVEPWLDAYEADITEWENSEDDMGYTKLYRNERGFMILLSYLRNGKVHRMFVDEDWSRAVAAVDFTDPYVSAVITSLLRIVYSQAILAHQAVAVHASAVICRGEVALFMGKSGTGKSTHAALWLNSFEGCSLLNDDNPTVCVRPDGVWVYGTPWSGKTPCYRNVSAPVKGMVRLVQSPENRYVALKEVEAFAALLPGAAVVSKERKLYNCLCDALVQIAERIEIGCLYCRPDRNAARLCRKSLDMK